MNLIDLKVFLFGIDRLIVVSESLYRVILGAVFRSGSLTASNGLAIGRCEEDRLVLLREQLRPAFGVDL